MASGIFKDLTGLRFERLVVLNRIPNKFGKVYWSCKCDCGNISQVRGDSLNKKIFTTKSCGCLQKEAASKNGKLSSKPAGTKLISDLFSNYSRRAKQMGKKFELSRNEFKKLIFSACFYCGLENSNKITHPKRKLEYIKYNGIDRVNSQLGYNIDNCVAACKQCNIAKLDYSKEEFFNWIRHVYQYNFGVK